MATEQRRPSWKRWASRNVEKIRAKKRRAHVRHREHNNARTAAWQKANRDQKCRADTAWRHAHPDLCAGYSSKWRKNNRGAMNAALARYRAMQRLATPSWADMTAIKAIYVKAARLTRETGTAYEVDHIVPLQGRFVCGLHVSYNLQILTQAANRWKNNKLLPDES